MNKYLSILLVLFITTFTACDIVEYPYVETTTVGDCMIEQACIDAAPSLNDPFAGVTIQKKVLLEEFTGHTCGMCPAATDIALKLRDETFKDQMVLVSMHAGGLAIPKTGGEFETDFRTETGEALYDIFFPIDAVPFGLINRTESEPGLHLFGPFKWETAISEELAKPVEAGIIITNCFDKATRELVTIVDVKYLVPGTDQEFLVVCLIEDEVIDWQRDYRLPSDQEDVPDYTHHEVFRKSLNGTWGQQLSRSEVPEGATYRVSLCHDLDADFDAVHCKIVAFVHNFTTKEVRQVEVASVE